MKLTWTTDPQDGYSVGDRLLDGVEFVGTVELDLDMVKARKSFFIKEAYKVTEVKPFSDTDLNYLLHIGGQGAVDLWCERMKDHMEHGQGELMTDEIFNKPEIQALWKEYHED